MDSAISYVITLSLVKMNGAHTESIGTGPELLQILMSP